MRMKMKYDEEGITCYNEVKLTYIPYVAIAVLRYRISLFSPPFSATFFENLVGINFDKNKERFLNQLKQLEKEVKKYANEEK